jgi:hypothetical protein
MHSPKLNPLLRFYLVHVAPLRLPNWSLFPTKCNTHLGESSIQRTPVKEESTFSQMRLVQERREAYQRVMDIACLGQTYGHLPIFSRV